MLLENSVGKEVLTWRPYVIEYSSFLVFYFSCSDIVKLTAQFVAKNGKAFLTNLMTREQVGSLLNIQVTKFYHYCQNVITRL